MFYINEINILLPSGQDELNVINYCNSIEVFASKVEKYIDDEWIANLNGLP